MILKRPPDGSPSVHINKKHVRHGSLVLPKKRSILLRCARYDKTIYLMGCQMFKIDKTFYPTVLTELQAELFEIFFISLILDLPENTTQRCMEAEQRFWLCFLCGSILENVFGFKKRHFCWYWNVYFAYKTSFADNLNLFVIKRLFL